jgi:hypothetical protein
MKCEVGNHFINKVDNQFGYCRPENEALRFEGFEGFVVCPKPEFVCGMKTFLGRNAMGNVATVTPPSTPLPEQSEATEGEPPPSKWPASTIARVTILLASTFFEAVAISGCVAARLAGRP